MAVKRGPMPGCMCGACPTCLRRAAARRRYRGVVAATPPSFKPSRLNVPADTAALAYIAGLFDGEGCITRHNGGWRLQLAMTDEPVIRWLGEVGGTVRERSVVGNRQRCWRWLVMRQVEVRQLLVALRPFLRVKGAQADRALAEIAVREAGAAARGQLEMPLVAVVDRDPASYWPAAGAVVA